MWVYMVEALLTGVFLGCVLSVPKSFWLASAVIQEQISSSWAKQRQAGQNKSLTTLLWLLSAEMLYPGCEFCSLRVPGCLPRAPGTLRAPCCCWCCWAVSCVPQHRPARWVTPSRAWSTAEVECEGTELCPLLHMAPVPCRAQRTFAASASAPRTATSAGTSTTRMCPRRTGE